jgi:hypothetical protein
MKAPEIKSDDTILAIRAVWIKEWKNNDSIHGSIQLKNGVFTFFDSHGESVITVLPEDIKRVHGYALILLPMGTTDAVHAAIRIVPNEKRTDWLYFTWDMSRYTTNRGRKYKEWLNAFNKLGVRTRNDGYWVNGLVIAIYCAAFWLLLRFTYFA